MMIWNTIRINEREKQQNQLFVQMPKNSIYSVASFLVHLAKSNARDT